MDRGAVPMTAPREYWFARRFPVGHARKAMAPVHWKGYAAAAIFVLVLFIGGGAFAWMGASGYLIQGIVVFSIAALIGCVWFITVATAMGDRTRTVADYQKDRRQRV
jgi:hypothetical protein